MSRPLSIVTSALALLACSVLAQNPGSISTQTITTGPERLADVQPRCPQDSVQPSGENTHSGFSQAFDDSMVFSD
jgi:hypothetical protein